jgi:hypothetical protein
MVNETLEPESSSDCLLLTDTCGYWLSRLDDMHKLDGANLVSEFRFPSYPVVS